MSQGACVPVNCDPIWAPHRTEAALAVVGPPAVVDRRAAGAVVTAGVPVAGAVAPGLGNVVRGTVGRETVVKACIAPYAHELPYRSNTATRYERPAPRLRSVASRLPPRPERTSVARVEPARAETIARAPVCESDAPARAAQKTSPHEHATRTAGFDRDTAGPDGCRRQRTAASVGASRGARRGGAATAELAPKAANSRHATASQGRGERGPSMT